MVHLVPRSDTPFPKSVVDTERLQETPKVSIVHAGTARDPKARQPERGVERPLGLHIVGAGGIEYPRVDVYGGLIKAAVKSTQSMASAAHLDGGI